MNALEFWQDEDRTQEEILRRCFIQILKSDFTELACNRFWDICSDCRERKRSLHIRARLKEALGAMDEGDAPRIEAAFFHVKAREFDIPQGRPE